MSIYQSKEYALYRLKSRLQFIEAYRPKLYEAIKEDGTLHATFFLDDWVKKYEAEGFTVRESELEEEIRSLKKSIGHYEVLVR